VFPHARACFNIGLKSLTEGTISKAEQVLSLKCLSNAFTGPGQTTMQQQAPDVFAAIFSADLSALPAEAFVPLATVLLK
jgi:hypothetical protein